MTVTQWLSLVGIFEALPGAPTQEECRAIALQLGLDRTQVSTRGGGKGGGGLDEGNELVALREGTWG